MKTKEQRKVTTIRIRPSIVQEARIAAVTTRKTIGEWLEQAIMEKVEREEGEHDVTEEDS